MTETTHNILALPPFWLALVFAVAVAGLAWSAGSLSKSGAIAACAVGFFIYWLGGARAAIPLLVFFVSASILSHIGKAAKADARRMSEKSGRRDAVQVLANGGIAAALVIIHRAAAYHVSLDGLRYMELLFLASLAAVNSDTWATEIGGLSPGSAFLVSNWKRARPGMSGAVTLLGTIGGLAGAIAIPLAVYRYWGLTTPEVAAVAWAGFLACLLDSVIGAGLQAQYRDSVSGEPSERAEVDGKESILVSGYRLVTNDVVNFLAAGAGAAFAWALLRYAVYSAR